MRVMMALVSAVVLTITGVGWWSTSRVVGGFTISNALGIDGFATAPAHGAINVLLIGLDSRRDQDGNELPQDLLDQLHAGDSDSGGYNTNTLILAHVSPDDHVLAFSIPRDDYVSVDDIPGYQKIKIKEAYGLKKADTAQKLNDQGVTDQHELESKGREAGRAATLAAVRDLTGVAVDHFAEVSLAGFYDLTSTLGGVDVCLNQAVSDDFSGADFPAGPQTLGPAAALAFVRQRHGLDNGDLDRAHRQQAFLVSVMHKLQDGGMLADIDQFTRVMAVARKDIVLSSGWTDDVFRRLAGISGANVEYRTLPVVRYDNVDGQDVNIVDPQAIRDQVAAAFSDDPSKTAAATGPTSTVDVVNGSSMTGLAAAVSAQLAAKGFPAGEVRNSAPGERTDTHVDYGSGAASDAAQLAKLLAISSTPQPVDSEAPSHIQVVLGSDYDPPPAIADSGGADVVAASNTQSDADDAAPDHGKPVDGKGIPCVD